MSANMVCANCLTSLTGAHVRVNRGRFYRDGPALVCMRCMDNIVHARIWPTCTHDWHDAYDHVELS